MILKRFYDDSLAQASFLIGCGTTGEAAVIDVNRDLDQYVQAAKAENLRIVAVTETHIHADFVSGSREIAQRVGATLYLSDEGDAEWKYAFAHEPNVKLLKNGDAIRVGNVRLDVLHTPGHTPEHLSFLLTDEPATQEPQGAFTGDFIFAGEVGRPDLLERAANYKGTMEKGARVLYASLRRFMESQPSHLMIWPGHGAGSACGKNLGGTPVSTLAYEKLVNWAMGVASEDQFVKSVLEGQPEPPRYFKEMKRINKTGPPSLGGFPRPQRLPDDSVERLLGEGAVVVDVRPGRETALGYIPGVLNIPLNKAFNTWAGWLLPYDQPIHLIAADEASANRAARDLAMIGLDHVKGWIEASGAMTAIARTAAPETVPQMSIVSAAEKMRSGEIHLLDVRGEGEYASGHIAGVQHIPLGYLAERAGEVPRDKPIVIQCSGGTRSPIGVSVLRRLGFKTLVNAPGGFNEYERAGLPKETGSATATTT